MARTEWVRRLHHARAYAMREALWVARKEARQQQGRGTLHVSNKRQRAPAELPLGRGCANRCPASAWWVDAARMLLCSGSHAQLMK